MTSDRLKLEQEKTLASRRMRYGLLARLLFVGMDLLYGRRKTLSKFKVLEVIARVPYQSWEHVAYIAITHTHAYPDLARRIFDRVKESRIPARSYLLNAHFEDHAEHEYMEYVAENPALEAEPFESMFADDYGRFGSLADLFRQIGYDERVHKLESLARVEEARFR